MDSKLKRNYKKYQKGTKSKKMTLGFLRSFLPEIIFRTTKLEGEPVTRKMVKSTFGWKDLQLNQKEQLRSKLLQLELEGTKRGLEQIFKIYKSEITPGLILDIYRESFGWIFPDWAGKYRSVRVEFSGKETVQPHQISELIINLCADLNERLAHLNTQNDNFINQVVELLAWFQHRFVWIHPFQDYNGRVARMLTILILLKLNLPPIEIKAETGLDRKRYLGSMYAADEGNYSKLENSIGTALNESLVKMS